MMYNLMLWASSPNICLGDEPGVKSEMDRLQTFQNRFAKEFWVTRCHRLKLLIISIGFPWPGEASVTAALLNKMLLEYFETFRLTSRGSHGYCT